MYLFIDSWCNNFGLHILSNFISILENDTLSFNLMDQNTRVDSFLGSKMYKIITKVTSFLLFFLTVNISSQKYAWFILSNLIDIFFNSQKIKMYSNLNSKDEIYMTSVSI